MARNGSGGTGWARGRWSDGSGVLWIDAPDAPPDASADTRADAATVVPLEIAASYRARTRGLLGREGIEGAMLLTPTGGVHTFRMGFAIDVAHLDRELRVLAVTTMRPGRLGLVRPRARCVLEAEAGAMARWGLRRGSRVRIGTPEEGPYGAR